MSWMRGENDLLNQKEAIALLGITEYYFKMWIKDGTLKLKGTPSITGSPAKRYTLKEVQEARRDLEERKRRVEDAIQNAKPFNQRA